MKGGKLVVFEGADGSGKTTQSKLLLKDLAKGGIPSQYISFPRYEESLWAGMVRRYLNGEFGNLNPFLASLAYAGDRAAAAWQMKKWIGAGKTVVCNRYIWSNAAHMGAKFKSQSERSKYINWLEQLEYGENGIPKEELVIFLSVPIAVSKKLMKNRNLDIHERDLDYQEKVIQVYDELCLNRKNWVKVDCTSGGKILKPEEIHKKVLEILRRKKIL